MKTSQATGCVFVSHSGQDNELVRDIARRLRDAGLKSFVDFEAVPNVAARKRRLRERLRKADAVLILVTPATLLRSSWTMTELGMAEAFDRIILPVMAGLNPRDLPAPLQSYQAVPFDQLDQAISKLSERLTGTVCNEWAR